MAGDQASYEVEVVPDRDGGVRIKKFSPSGREVAWIPISRQNREEFLQAFREACVQADQRR
jgi:hypothetical protein